MKEIKVLIVDDSAMVRKILTRQLSGQKDINVVGAAPDPYVAREMIVQFDPDVITLDIEMPRMDGITFLKKVMKYKPTPVIVVSSLSHEGSHLAMEAFSAGALEVVSKPGSAFSVDDMGRELIHKVRTAATANVSARTHCKDLDPSVAVSSKALSATTHKIIAIGASTGGTQAVQKVLEKLPANSPGILVVQHMPAYFTKNFAERLNSLCAIDVKEAQDGDSVVNGHALIAPGNFHMRLQRSGSRYYVSLEKGPMVHHQRPAVDVLFKSVAKFAGKNALGIILTGMGADGADGLKAMKDAGSYTIGQDEASCIVYGMPKEAVRLGAVDVSLDIDQIAAAALKAIHK